MDEKKDKIVSGILITTGICILGVKLIKYLKSKSNAIISDISWISREDNMLELSWYDEDDENQIYKIYISEQRQININDKKTYKNRYPIIYFIYKF